MILLLDARASVLIYQSNDETAFFHLKKNNDLHIPKSLFSTYLGYWKIMFTELYYFQILKLDLKT
jgi:hypothetical protein